MWCDYLRFGSICGIDYDAISEWHEENQIKVIIGEEADASFSTSWLVKRAI
jgi:hypothetical protein